MSVVTVGWERRAWFRRKTTYIDQVCSYVVNERTFWEALTLVGFVGKRPEDEDEGIGLTLYEFWQEILLKEFDTLVTSKGYDTSVKVWLLL